MNKLEKDVLILTLIDSFVPTGLQSIYSDYDKQKVTSNKVRFMKDNETAIKALVDLATESYNRILKKTT